MTVLTHVCFSDLHCGAPTSLLTPLPRFDRQFLTGKTADPAEATSALFAQALMATVGQFQPPSPPDLILLGDVFDLSFSTPQAATTAFNLLLKNLHDHDAPTRLGRVLLVPGNHDHSLWTSQRQQRFGRTSAPGAAFGPEIVTTPAFAPASETAGSGLIESMLRAAGFDNPTSTYYPNLGLRSADGSRAVLLHHGHFVEQLYTMVSSLVSHLTGAGGLVSSVDEIERLNGGWIDFFWSTIGEAGRAGNDVFLTYDYLLTGAEAIRFQHRLARLLADWLRRTLPLWRTKPMEQALQLVASGIVDATFGQFGEVQRFDYTKVLGEAGILGLKAYLDGPTFRQMLSELNGQPLPTDLTFVFGHTHKPFEDRMTSSRFPTPPAIYNSGGWVLDTPQFGSKQGASLLFIDSDRNVAALRLFGPPAQDGLDPGPGAPVPVRVMTADGQTPDDNPLAQALHQALAATEDLWAQFSHAVDATYRDKQAFILDVLRRRDIEANGKETVL